MRKSYAVASIVLAFAFGGGVAVVAAHGFADKGMQVATEESVDKLSDQSYTQARELDSAYAWWQDQPDVSQAMFCSLLRDDEHGLLQLFTMEGNRDRVTSEQAQARITVMRSECP